ncbi:MarR family winged helix-turn-helix transcriptional regulator [Nocardia huaxiensis]|uniref:MarR family winged helix-turn-helix transcriptional regulator n=1 Tax=Nocardia huaxiensis TaxID=2755382 RepID=UPI001E5EC388|nr:MarR family transcriptional regulator [Nocardia huaxiensis]UFS94307.1 MarR family transcriptional regulator [Nocardia huaxiensis]
MTDAAPEYPPLSDHPAFLLGQLGSHVAYRFTELLAPLGIRPAQFGMLRILRANDGLSQQQLCEALGIHRNVMVGLVDDLEKRGFAQRRRHPVDRRAHAVHLLPAAEELLAAAERIVSGLNDELLESLSPGDRSTLVTLLQRAAAGNGLTPGVHPGLTDQVKAQDCRPPE